MSNLNVHLAGWLPKGSVSTAESTSVVLCPPIRELKELIEASPAIYMSINTILAIAKVATDYNDLLTKLNQSITQAPAFGDPSPPFHKVIFDAIHTHAGLPALLLGRLDAQFKKIFGHWTAFLSSPGSTHVLHTNPGGWFSPPALEALCTGFGDGNQFADVFKCDPTKDAWGFVSWDAFFTRELREGVRPVEKPGDARVISAAFEGVLYKAIGAHDSEFLEFNGREYTLRQILNDEEEYLDILAGGSVFQGSAVPVTGYHRLHAPVDGVLKKVVTIPGAYFSHETPPPSDFDDQLEPSTNPYHVDIRRPSIGLDLLGPQRPLETRTLIYIESTNPVIGLMCIAAIGLTESSMFEATVGVGQRVNRGEELGMFHFGGSSHCLIFRKEAGVQWDEGVARPGEPVRVRSAIEVAQG